MTEIKACFFAISLFILFMEMFLVDLSGTPDFPRGACTLVFISFYFLYSVFDYIVSRFVRSKAASLFLLLPAALLFFLLRDTAPVPYIGYILACAAAVRILFALIPKRELVLTCGCLVMDAGALQMHFREDLLNGRYATDRILFILLAVMTLAAIQELFYERRRQAFPFYFFCLTGIVLLMFPMRRDPINWDPVIRVGENFIQKVWDAANSASYFFSSTFGDDSYTAEYSSLEVKGDSIAGSDRTQLILRTHEKPYYLYKDEKSYKNMRMRRVLYLTGGRGVENAQLVGFLRFMRDCGMDKEYASMFSRVSLLNVEYAYLDTADEIAPYNSLILSDGKERIAGGVGNEKHKKGYRIRADWLDIDYGSSYLTDLMRDAAEREHRDFSYADACKCMTQLYNISFENIMSEQAFEEAAKELQSVPSAFMDTAGATDRMADLARKVTDGAESDYDKCRKIEAYLRQYTYDTDAAGGHDPNSDMSTAAGMSDIADRFLFETERGYCVHYTSSMVMLLRLAGIPARCAKGYRYEFPFEEQDSYLVSGNCAHVWPEAYIASVGWVPFEPTAAMRTAGEYTWHRRMPREETHHEQQGTESVPSLPQNTSDGSTESTKEMAPILYRVILPVAVSIILLLAVLLLGTYAAGYLRYRLGTPEQKLLMDVAAIRRMIQKRSGGFTDRGLMSDYVERVPEEMRLHLQKVIATYYRIIYGNSNSGGVSAEENALARSLREQLREKRYIIGSGSESDISLEPERENEQKI